MVCRHGPNDTDCSSHPDNPNNPSSRYYSPEPLRNDQYPVYTPPMSTPVTPDPNQYEVIDAQEVGANLVLKVKYPNCKNCNYEGTKIMVFANASAMTALKWRKIDPHFTDPKRAKRPANEAPSPVGRFPGDADGWADAIAFAQAKGARKKQYWDGDK